MKPGKDRPVRAGHAAGGKPAPGARAEVLLLEVGGGVRAPDKSISFYGYLYKIQGVANFAL